MNKTIEKLKSIKLGQGTWKMGESPSSWEDEKQALKLGVSLGMTLIDTAEMYGNGKSEKLIGEALNDINRNDYQLVSKVYPYNAGKEHIFTSCDSSLKRLNTDYLDVYLLHWRGQIPLIETVSCMEELVKLGKIRSWGVSNFDTDDMKALWNVHNGNNCVLNQVLYHLGSRGIEFDLIPWHKANNVITMAYCPIAKAGALRQELISNPVINQIADKHDVSVVQLLLAFSCKQDSVFSIPKAKTLDHIRANSEVLSLSLSEEDWLAINHAYPEPTAKVPLDMN